MLQLKLLVAIVEDDHELLESLGDMLLSAGYAVRTFSSAEAFLEGVHLNEFDCLITDFGLGGLSGFELKEQLGIVSPDLPIIVMTGAFDAYEAYSRKASAGMCFRKPFDGDAMLDAVAGAIAGAVSPASRPHV
jgi:FixJ family two-component response regulator